MTENAVRFHRKPDCIFVCFIDGDTIMNYNIRDIRNEYIIREKKENANERDGTK